MTTIDVDLCSIQEARDLVRSGKVAADKRADLFKLISEKANEGLKL